MNLQKNILGVYFAKRKNKIEYDLFSSKLLFIKEKKSIHLTRHTHATGNEAVFHQIFRMCD